MAAVTRIVKFLVMMVMTPDEQITGGTSAGTFLEVVGSVSRLNPDKTSMPA